MRTRPSRRVSRRLIEVRNAPVGRKHRIDGEVHTANHPLVRPGIVPAPNVDANDFGNGGFSEHQQHQCTDRR